MKRRAQISVLIGLALAGIAFLVIPYVMMFGSQLSHNRTDWANFGDYLGGVAGPVLGFLSFVLLVATYLLQQQELKETRAEFKKSTEAQENSAAALAEQVASSRHQTFENTFFQLLHLHHEIVRGIELRDRDGNVTSTGRDAMRVLYTRLREEFFYNASNQRPTRLEQCAFVYQEFYGNNGHKIGHYFRNLYRIYKFIDASDVTDKKNYTGIVRAQLSNSEMLLLFYNGLSSRGSKFRAFIERYAALENMPTDELVIKAQDLRLYAADAYGEDAKKPAG